MGLRKRERETRALVALLRCIYVCTQPLSTEQQEESNKKCKPMTVHWQTALSAFSVPQHTTKYEAKKKIKLNDRTN